MPAYFQAAFTCGSYPLDKLLFWVLSDPGMQGTWPRRKLVLSLVLNTTQQLKIWYRPSLLLNTDPSLQLHSLSCPRPQHSEAVILSLPFTTLQAQPGQNASLPAWRVKRLFLQPFLTTPTHTDLPLPSNSCLAVFSLPSPHPAAPSLHVPCIYISLRQQDYQQI